MERDYDCSRIVRWGDDDEPAVERMPGWRRAAGVLAALFLVVLIGVGLRAAWVAWEAMR